MKNFKTLKEFEIACNNIAESIKRIDNKNAIIDGVINIEKYYNLPNNKPRILWILKEANAQGEGWDYQDLLSTVRLTQTNNHSSIISLRRVILSSYCILENCKMDGQLPNIYDVNVYKTAEEIAYININKLSGGVSSVSDRKMRECYSLYKEIVFKQISVYEPDIIIFGGTERFFSFEDLNISLDNRIEMRFGNNDKFIAAITKQNDKLYFAISHPAYFRISDLVYCKAVYDMTSECEKSRI